MDRLPVQSSNIRAVGYDPDVQSMEVEFHDGSVYLYEGISENVYEGLMSAQSVGKHFRDNIREEYEYYKLS